MSARRFAPSARGAWIRSRTRIWPTPCGKIRRRYGRLSTTHGLSLHEESCRRSTEFVTLGIYKLEGDTLTVCRSHTSDAVRQKGFKTTADAGILVVYKRGKND